MNERLAQFKQQQTVFENFRTSQPVQSQAIQLATHSPYSHCGIQYRQHGKWQVFEAVQPVRLTPLAA